MREKVGKKEKYTKYSGPTQNDEREKCRQRDIERER